jgi:hypothetical protein
VPSEPLETFYRYVFSGAPWKRGSFGMCRASKDFRCVGNRNAPAAYVPLHVPRA